MISNSNGKKTSSSMNNNSITTSVTTSNSSNGNSNSNLSTTAMNNTNSTNNNNSTATLNINSTNHHNNNDYINYMNAFPSSKKKSIRTFAMLVQPTININDLNVMTKCFKFSKYNNQMKKRGEKRKLLSSLEESDADVVKFEESEMKKRKLNAVVNNVDTSSGAGTIGANPDVVSSTSLPEIKQSQYEKYIHSLQQHKLQDEYNQNKEKMEKCKSEYETLQMKLMELKKQRKKLNKNDGDITTMTNADEKKIPRTEASTVSTADTLAATSSVSSGSDQNNETKIKSLQNQKEELMKKLKSIQESKDGISDIYEKKKQSLIKEKKKELKRKLKEVLNMNKNSQKNMNLALKKDDSGGGSGTKDEEGNVAAEKSKDSINTVEKMDHEDNENYEEGEVIESKNNNAGDHLQEGSNNDKEDRSTGDDDNNDEILAARKKMEAEIKGKQDEINKLNKTKANMAWLMKTVIMAEQKNKLMMKKMKSPQK